MAGPSMPNMHTAPVARYAKSRWWDLLCIQYLCGPHVPPVLRELASHGVEGTVVALLLALHNVRQLVADRLGRDSVSASGCTTRMPRTLIFN